MRVTTILGAAAALAGSIASAQTATPKTDSGCVTSSDGRIECRKVVLQGGPAMFRFDHARMDSAMMKRPILGLELRPTGSKRDTLGVFVESVIPKGPAELAGIYEGDRISAINGVDLRVASADVDDPYTNGLAAHRLNREVQKLAPGARVTLRVYSGGRFRDVPVTAGRASDFPDAGGFRIRLGGSGMMEFDGPGGMRMGAPGGFGMDGEQMRMMIENGMQPSTVHPMPPVPPAGLLPTKAPLVRMKTPFLQMKTPMAMPLMRVKAPMLRAPLRPTRLIRV